MNRMNRMVRGAGLVAVLMAALAMSACANKQATDSLASAGVATPGSQQDFVVNVGDRVFFEIRFLGTHVAGARHARQAGAVAAATIAPTRSPSKATPTNAARANTTSRSARAARRRCVTISIARGVEAVAHAHRLLRQGAAGRGLQRHILLVAEPPRRHGARRHLVDRRLCACARSRPAPASGAGLRFARGSRR